MELLASHVLVMDWGLAKIAGGSSQSRAAAEAGLGSPAYGQTLARRERQKSEALRSSE